MAQVGLFRAITPIVPTEKFIRAESDTETDAPVAGAQGGTSWNEHNRLTSQAGRSASHATSVVKMDGALLSEMDVPKSVMRPSIVAATA